MPLAKKKKKMKCYWFVINKHRLVSLKINALTFIFSIPDGVNK